MNKIEIELGMLQRRVKALEQWTGRLESMLRKTILHSPTSYLLDMLTAEEDEPAVYTEGEEK